MRGAWITTRFDWDTNTLYVTTKTEACNQSMTVGMACGSEQSATLYTTDLYTGRVTSVTDANGVSTVTGYDPFGRPVTVTEGTGGAQRTTTITYHDVSPAYQTTASTLDAGRSVFTVE